MAGAIFGDVGRSDLFLRPLYWTCDEDQSENYFSWQAQYFAKLERHFSWQAQHFVKIWEVGTRNVVFLESQ